jgi:hypothetical protein
MKNGFINGFVSVTTGDGHICTLLTPLVYRAKNGDIITIPSGAPTDGASVPQAMWNIIPPFGKYWLAAIMHDYLYRFTLLPKDRCDDLFLEAMESCGVDEILAHTIYEGVHLGGWKAFREDRNM